MDESTFTYELKKIADEVEEKITALVLKARTENADGPDGNQPVEFSEASQWERAADGIAESVGWLYDRMAGRNRMSRGSITVKIRKALGYGG